MKFEGKTCDEKVRDKGMWPSYHDCKKKAKALRDGRFYCGIHDPVRIAERQAKRYAEQRSTTREATSNRIELAVVKMRLMVDRMDKMNLLRNNTDRIKSNLETYLRDNDGQWEAK